MPKDDWLRSSVWTPKAARDFEKRLARSQRKACWLNFKADVLATSSAARKHQAARGLYERVIRDHAEELPDVAVAHQSLAKLLAKAGSFDQAAVHYRRCLAAHAAFEKSHAYDESHPALELAELLLIDEDPLKHREAHQLLANLEATQELSLFPGDVLRHALASARVATRLKKARAQSKFANRALSIAGEHQIELAPSTLRELRAFVGKRSRGRQAKAAT